MASPSIPAPGFRVLEKGERPHLVTEALAAVRALRQYRKVDSQVVELVVTLCDRVEASHGQYYGSWDRLLIDVGWKRSWLFKWLPKAEELGLVADLGRLPGRKTTTWQVLPHRYRLESTSTDSRPVESTITDTTSAGHSP